MFIVKDIRMYDQNKVHWVLPCHMQTMVFRKTAEMLQNKYTEIRQDGNAFAREQKHQHRPVIFGPTSLVGWDAIRCFFFVSLELLLRFLQQVGGRVENQEAAKPTATDPSVLTSLSGLLVSSCTLLSLPRSHGLGGVCTFSHGDVPLELLCTSNIFLSKIVLMDCISGATGTS